MAEIEDSVIAEAAVEGSVEVECGRAEDHSGQHSDGERVDAEALMEEDGSEDDAGVIDERADGLVEEDLANEEARAQHSAEEEEELRGAVRGE